MIGVLISVIWHINWLGAGVFLLFVIGQVVYLVRQTKNINKLGSSMTMIRLPKKYDKRLVNEIFTGDIVNYARINRREDIYEICSIIRKKSVAYLQASIGGTLGAVVITIDYIHKNQIVFNMMLIIVGMLLGAVLEWSISKRVRKIEQAIRFQEEYSKE